MKQKWWIIALIAVLHIALIAAVWLIHRESEQDPRDTTPAEPTQDADQRDPVELPGSSTGLYIRMESGVHMIVMDDGPVVMSDREGKDLFADLYNGDKIRIRHGLIRETYPGGTDVYSCTLISEGSLADISQDLLDVLAGMGYTPAERCREPVQGTDLDIQVPEKPVIYLYPQVETQITVELIFDGSLTATYPKYENGWKVLAKPDGSLWDPRTGREYYCLFWEGITDAQYDFTKGFVVAGQDTVPFLEDALTRLGLTDREANEFIIYWAPRMEKNPWNLISFQQEAYTDSARLEISPKPDTLIRVFMAWKALEAPVQIQPQVLSAPQRNGFVAVEWGGAEVTS